MRFTDGLYPELAFRPIGGRMTYEGGGGKGSAPAAPDYTGAAQQQAQSSKETTTMQNFANRPNQQTPWGGTTWTPTSTTDPSTGQQVTQWTQNLNLTPDSQHALDSQLQVQSGRSDIANSVLPRVQQEMSTPWDFSQFTPRAGGDMNTPTLDTSAPTQTTRNFDPNQFSAERDQFIAAQRKLMDPYHDQNRQLLDSKLINQGITQGSAAYEQAKREQADQFARDDLQAIAGGQQEQLAMHNAGLAQEGQAFGQDVASQQAGNQAQQAQQGVDITGANFTNNLRMQQIVEEMQRRGMSLNEINALLTGQQVQTPQMPGFVTAAGAQPTQFLSAAQLTGQHGLDVYNTEQMARQGMMSGLFGLGGTALQKFA